ncbi:uncharacterized protein (TIGR00255 family) [Sinorhizobium kostiense]|uniref:Uncharacterized protein (TIGR00255 family) n=1 Tax=Sinorhizobium kostiense TaxID=76747 RepID=A0ABS4QY13_9HYPH|nr:YicC/YloC family endoribonuclease [Sinorhizobium kostiense]MBP2235031.1 uncharacterized protein (TIGR00255 family) [Sinorhizobium kostiense]
MPLQSMTGFARREGSIGRYRWAWELRSVNGKGLDLRLRLPQGLERFEPDCRRLAAQYFARGNLQVSLSLASGETAVEAVINHEALAAVMKLREKIVDIVDPAPLRFDTLLSIRGIVDFRESEESETEREARDADILAGLEQALFELKAMREEEGSALGRILFAHVDQIERLKASIDKDPSRSHQAIAERLAQQIALVMENASSIDRERLHSEVALLATKADLKEEIDRLGAHIAAARDLLTKGGPIGRKLDFLAQEFNRESNTICSKANAATVSAAGIELKVVIDQFREQVQNLE